MGQFSAMFNGLARSLSVKKGKISRNCGGREAADAMMKDAKKNDLILKSSGIVSADGSNNFAAVFSKRGKKGINQDCYIVWEEFGCQKDMMFCGIFDGHGPWGHFVAKMVREAMPSSLLCNWQETLAQTSIDTDFDITVDKKLDRFNMWKHSYLKTCAAVDQELEQHPGIDSFYSGTTALTIVRQMIIDIFMELATNVTCEDLELLFLIDVKLTCSLEHMSYLAYVYFAVQLIKNLRYSPNFYWTDVFQGDLIVLANVGDSRAVLATTSDDGNLVPVQLTVDFKPNLPQEAERIMQCKGRVFCLEDEPGVHRVWPPYEETLGLAMSRAFGDYCVKDFGLISVPEVTQWNITSRDHFVVLATDGVWDVLSNQEAVQIVASSPDRSKAAKCLVDSAVRAWKRKRRGIATDDISAICLFFHTPPLSQQIHPVSLPI
ncbi:PPM-type phosphatase-like domain [Dillenia turbinata]|uniref:PPM-type phosphatase-like domain n=1 Tax=Dillenia turbinata TaxID=194707 RepID=A0AAN8UF28_9MAGN